MAYSGQILRSPFVQTGLRDDRSKELLPVTSLTLPSKNLNFHENGLSKRGGTALLDLDEPLEGPLQGGFDFRLYDGSSFKVFAADGNVYNGDVATVLNTGQSETNPISFAQIGILSGQDTLQNVFWADGQITPQYWDGVAAISSAVTPATSWSGSSGMPFQLINHSRNANVRLWALTRDSVWASKLGDPADFSDANVVQIPVYTEGGLVGGFDLGGQLFVYSKTKTYLINDFDISAANWGYQESLWEGGAAHWRVICKAINNLYIMADDGTIYTLQGIQGTGSYAAQPLARPAYIDKFIREQVTLQNIENFHCTYDRKLRCVKFFMQSGIATGSTYIQPDSGGATNNMAVCYYVDKPPTDAWIIHDNENFDSGYKASCSFEVRNGPGDWQIWTGDYDGNIWKLEQPTRDDDGNPYKVRIKTIRQDLGAPRSWKHFRGLVFRGTASGQVDFTIESYVDGIRQGTGPTTFVLTGSGALFDVARFDVDSFAGDSLVPRTIDVGYYGRDFQAEFVNNAIGQDFFFSELLYLYSPRGIKVA